MAIVDRDGECRAIALAVGRHHLRQLELREALLLHRHANNPAGVANHERDHVRRRMLGRHDQVTLVFPVLVIEDDDHSACAKLGQNVLDAVEGGPTGLVGRRAGRQREDVRHGADLEGP